MYGGICDLHVHNEKESNHTHTLQLELYEATIPLIHIEVNH